MPSRDQIRAVAEDIVPALRELQAPVRQPQPSRSPDRTLAAVHLASRPRPAAAIAPDGPAPEPTRATS